MPTHQVRLVIWSTLLLLVFWGVADLILRYQKGLEIQYLISVFFSSSIGVMIAFIKPIQEN